MGLDWTGSKSPCGAMLIRDNETFEMSYKRPTPRHTQIRWYISTDERAELLFVETANPDAAGSGFFKISSF